jgi:hypothetical protein
VGDEFVIGNGNELENGATPVALFFDNLAGSALFTRLLLAPQTPQ